MPYLKQRLYLTFLGRTQVLCIAFEAFDAQHYNLFKDTNIPIDFSLFIKRRHYVTVGFMNIFLIKGHYTNVRFMNIVRVSRFLRRGWVSQKVQISYNMNQFLFWFFISTSPSPSTPNPKLSVCVKSSKFKPVNGWFLQFT